MVRGIRRDAGTMLPLILVVHALSGCSDQSSPTPPGHVELTFEDVLAGDLSVAVQEGAPLSAEATFSTTEPVDVRVRVMGDLPFDWSSDGPASEHRIPLLGLYPGRENEVEVVLSTADGKEVADTLLVETEPLPPFFPRVRVSAARPSRMEPGWTLSAFSYGDGGQGRFLSYPFAFDENGDVRWYLDLSSFGGIVFLVEPLDNGNLVLGHGNSVMEYDWLGRRVNLWSFPGYLFHHDVIEKDDGNFIVAVDAKGESTVEDHVIEVDRRTGDVVRVWDFREILDPGRTAYMDNERDWFHMNAVWWDEEDDALIVSGRNQSAVVKVTADGELVWILSAQRGWGVRSDGTDLSEFLLTPVDAGGRPYPPEVADGEEPADGFRWPWGQHAPALLPNGNLLLFDNGLNRNFRLTPNGGGFSRGVEYAIDEEAMTIRQVWQYGRERGPPYYSSIISDVDHLPSTGNRLVMPGITQGHRAWATEVTHPGREVVFDASIHFLDLHGTGLQEWGQFDLVYRSERVRPGG